MNSFNVHAWISNLGVKSLKLNCSFRWFMCIIDKLKKHYRISGNLGGIKFWQFFKFLLIGWFKFVAMCH